MSDVISDAMAEAILWIYQQCSGRWTQTQTPLVAHDETIDPCQVAGAYSKLLATC